MKFRKLSACLDHVEKVLGEHHADRMNRLMPGEPLSLQPFNCFNHDFFPKGDLVLDNDMDDCVNPLVREGNAMTTMVFGDHVQSISLWRLEPFVSDWCHARIVFLQS